MMISPESYYEMELKGKTTAQIMSVIHDLQNTIEQLKNVMENPDYRNQPKIHPSESVQVSCMRLYLEKAKNALAKTGGIYIPSEAELTAADFEENISAISKLVFSVSDAVTGAAYECDIRTYVFDEKHVYSYYGRIHDTVSESAGLSSVAKYVCSKEQFLEKFRKLHIGEWRGEYDLNRFGYYILDGTRWELEIYYSNGHEPVKKCGYNNAYPYNFDEFKSLLDYGR